jgi:hypothetical protein
MIKSGLESKKVRLFRIMLCLGFCGIPPISQLPVSDVES